MQEEDLILLPALMDPSNSFFFFFFFFFLSWRDSPLVGLGLLFIHEDFCGF